MLSTGNCRPIVSTQHPKGWMLPRTRRICGTPNTVWPKHCMCIGCVAYRTALHRTPANFDSMVPREMPPGGIPVMWHLTWRISDNVRSDPRPLPDSRRRRSIRRRPRALQRCTATCWTSWILAWGSSCRWSGWCEAASEGDGPGGTSATCNGEETHYVKQLSHDVQGYLHVEW